MKLSEHFYVSEHFFPFEAMNENKIWFSLHLVLIFWIVIYEIPFVSRIRLLINWWWLYDVFCILRWVENNQEAPYEGKQESQYLWCKRRNVEQACTDLREREGEPTKEINAGSFG